jgi:ectoine hydroxylase-related dioxygenase (phytanoyl-CoA dioxygenase family)
VQSRWYEDVAKQVLRSGSVRLIGFSATVSHPSAGPDEQHHPYHIDEQYLPKHLAASPVPLIHGCSFWLWVSDVPASDAGPIRVHPGSHLQLAEAWAHDPVLQPAQLPLHIGLEIDRLPPDVVARMEPAEPVLAAAGEVTLFNYGTLHSSSAVLRGGSSRGRKMILCQLGDAQVLVRRNSDAPADHHARMREIQRQFCPERAYLCDQRAVPRL